MRADAVRLAQAVGNLLANALEHAGARVELRREGAGDGVRVEVRDDGRGLPAPVASLTRRPAPAAAAGGAGWRSPPTSPGATAAASGSAVADGARLVLVLRRWLADAREMAARTPRGAPHDPAPLRRRALLLAGLSLLLGGLAASDVAGREAALDRRIGPARPRRRRDERHRRGRPARPAPPRGPARARAVRAPRRGRGPPRRSPASGLGAVAAGADVSGSALAGPAGAAGAPVRAGERVADVVATGARGPRRRRIPRGRPGHARAAPRGAGGTDARPRGRRGARGEPARAGGRARRVAASLRVTVRQAVYLAAAQSFARELRLLPRAAGDRERSRGAVRMTEALG